MFVILPHVLFVFIRLSLINIKKKKFFFTTLLLNFHKWRLQNLEQNSCWAKPKLVSYTTGTCYVALLVLFLVNRIYRQPNNAKLLFKKIKVWNNQNISSQTTLRTRYLYHLVCTDRLWEWDGEKVCLGSNKVNHIFLMKPDII